MKSLSSILLIALLSFPLYSQSPIKFSGQIRPRVEVDKRNFHLNANPASTIFLRSRLNAAYSPSEDLSVFMQIQDSRFMGQEKNTQTNLGNLDIKEAYFELKNVFKTTIDIKAGRMAVAYGNERLIGAADWGNYGRSFDGIIGKFKNDFIKLDVFGFKESESLLAKDSLDKDMFGFWSEIYLNDNQTLQPFFIWNSENYNSIYRTLGLNWIGKFEQYRFETEFAYQHNNSWGNKEEAYLGAVNIYKKISDFEISAGLDYLSGAFWYNRTRDPFNTLYATNHKFYGYMDYL
ncbi:MAG TPA: alginate export family protein, partial [Ignavibacteriales bacterium]|nr:alginate export family protein [Ignavibacteriales bacterium]